MKTLAILALAALALAMPGRRLTSAETPYLPYTLNAAPEVKRLFHGADRIEIHAVIGTAPSFEAGGTYRLAGICRKDTIANGVLYLGNTAEAGSAAIVPLDGSSLTMKCEQEVTTFDVTFKLLRAGTLHLTVYDRDNHDPADNAYAGVFLGEVAAKH